MGEVSIIGADLAKTVFYRRAKSLICRAWVSLRRRAGFTGAHRAIQKARRYSTCTERRQTVRFCSVES